MNLREKYQLYLKLLPEAQDEYGFIESHEGDSLIMTGLLGCDPNVYLEIQAAQESPGKWLRRPRDNPAYPGHSKSSISRDMLIGALFYFYYNKRLDLIEDTIKYAFKNWFIMGEAVDFKTKIGRCLMTPTLLTLYCWASYKLGGPNRWWIRWIPYIPGKKLTGFRAHLAMLGSFLYKELSGSKRNDKVMRDYSKREPNNAFFQIAAGNYEEAERILKDKGYFPEHRLPASKDRSESWLWQRNEYKDGQKNPDWLPSNSNHTHSGGDFIFAYWLLNERKLL